MFMGGLMQFACVQRLMSRNGNRKGIRHIQGGQGLGEASEPAPGADLRRRTSPLKTAQGPAEAGTTNVRCAGFSRFWRASAFRELALCQAFIPKKVLALLRPKPQSAREFRCRCRNSNMVNLQVNTFQ